jgi:hypothetical protein
MIIVMMFHRRMLDMDGAIGMPIARVVPIAAAHIGVPFRVMPPFVAIVPAAVEPAAGDVGAVRVIVWIFVVSRDNSVVAIACADGDVPAAGDEAK